METACSSSSDRAGQPPDTMTDASTDQPARGLGQWPAAGQWALLLALSGLLILPLEALHLPAALLLGPMIAGIAMGAGASRIAVPAPVFTVAQAVIGCLMARALPPSIFVELVRQWPIYVVGISAVIAVAAAIGITLTRLRVLPGTTAIWGSAPGASTAMILMANAFGADARLVAFMLYLRVVMVAIAASVVARLFVGGEMTAPAVDWFPPVAAIPFAQTIALIVVALVATRLLRVPAGAIILPMFLGIALQDVMGLRIELPPMLLAVSYALVGWAIGLRFTRDILMHAARALPVVLGSTLLLIATCGLFAALLVWFAGIDPLTAYLATSPGGADSVAIIAANAKVDVPFVMAMQAGRFIVVLLTGPALARFIATRSGIVDVQRPA
jgi:membrane AbrB-like protein